MPTPKLSMVMEDAILRALKTGDTHAKIAKTLGVSVGTVSNIKNKVELDPTDTRILQLEAQNLTLQDDNRRCKLAYKAVQRENSIFESLVDEIQSSVKPITPLPKIKRLNGKKQVIRETLVAHLSDEHADQIVLPHQVGGLERYDFRIALRRAEQYVDTLLKFSQSTLSNYRFDTLWILAHGDHTSGEIHNAKDHSEYRNAFRNSLAVGQMHALMLRDLAPHFNDVKILYLSGNHGRRTPKKEYQAPWNNWDYLIAEIARAHCRDIENIEFKIPESFSACVEIEGWGFAVSHGDDVRSWNSIPWYGLERKTRRLAALNASQKKKIDYYCFGHFHNPAMQANLNGETIINGSWVATSPYVYESLSTYNEPSQWLHGVHKNFGISWRLNMRLRTELEYLGPNRYHIELAKEY